MAIPTSLTPVSTTSFVILTSTGSEALVNAGCPFGVYSDSSSELYSTDFLSGASDQVSFVYRKLGGDVLDIELVPANVYASMEEATLEYSYIVNMHQAKNVMSNMLGQTTGTFDQDGNLKDSQLKTDLSGSHMALKYPKFSFGYAKKIAMGVGNVIGVGGDKNVYSASFDIISEVQDYDLQSLVSGAATTGSMDFAGKIGNKRISIKKMYYKTPAAAWRFFGMYGGLNVAGDMLNYSSYGYGQYSDATTYEVVPVWEHKLQARAYEDSIYTRCSHYSYEIKNNKIRLYPKPVNTTVSPSKFWFEFTVDDDSWTIDDKNQKSDIDGVNNMNTLPFGNIPYGNINGMGKNWIRNYSLALCKEMLGQIRGKFATLPIPNNNVTLNAEQLLSQAKDEKEKLREELKKALDELTYVEVAKREADMAEAALRTQVTIPNLIFTG
jgi:hypothetical protein